MSRAGKGQRKGAGGGGGGGVVTTNSRSLQISHTIKDVKTELGVLGSRSIQGCNDFYPSTSTKKITFSNFFFFWQTSFLLSRLS